MRSIMKIALPLLALGASVLASSASVCLDKGHATGDALQKVLDYKKSDHELMGAYFRAWRDSANGPDSGKNKLTDLPDCVDMVFVFAAGYEKDAFYTALNDSYVPTLHSRGTKVIRTLDIGYLTDTAYANTQAGYDQLAQHLVDAFVTPYGLDGLDIDVERSLSRTQLQQAVGVFKSLSKFLGPKSGTDKVLIYDTNQDGNTPLFSAVSSYVSYVAVQSYGRSISSLQYTWNTFSNKISSKQYFIGFSFYEEGGATWHDADAPMSYSRAWQYAAWNPYGAKKGGIFSYATDRDGVPSGSNDLVTSTFSWTSALIHKMNP